MGESGWCRYRPTHSENRRAETGDAEAPGPKFAPAYLTGTLWRTPRWALKFIGGFRDEKMRPYLSVVAFSRRGILLEPIVYTAYHTRLSQIDSKRVGWLLYGKCA